jgi:hypothetical protein
MSVEQTTCEGIYELVDYQQTMNLVRIFKLNNINIDSLIVSYFVQNRSEGF